jgi:hypothetical protein
MYEFQDTAVPEVDVIMATEVVAHCAVNVVLLVALPHPSEIVN